MHTRSRFTTHSWLATVGWSAIIAAAAVPAAAQSQTDAPDAVRAADAAYQACVPENARDRPPAELRAAADEAERRFRELVRSGVRPLDARVGLAQVLVRCQLPHANPLRIMALVEEAERELRAVLARAPTHWSARFLLATTLHNMPAMLGRGDEARAEFEHLIAQQGTRSEGPHFALPYAYLGDHHLGAGRRDAAIQVWRRGLALHPDFPLLVERLEKAGVAAEPDTAWLEAAASSPGEPATSAASAQQATVYALAPLRAEATNHQFHDARSGTTLRRLDVYTMPGGTGEMLQALQALPGATRAGDGAELYIRGGDPAETPVFFDGGRLAFPGRWESLQGAAMGVVDASVLRRVYFSSGGFSARYGNALSGIVDVETEGRPARAAYRFGANMVQAGGSLRAPLGATTGAWGTLSATDTRVITHMNGQSDLYERSPQSVQGIGGVTYEPAPGIELRATALSVGDRYTRRMRMNAHDGSFASGSSMQHVAFTGRALRPDGRRGVLASVTASRRSNALSFGVLDRDREDRALGARVEADAVVFAGTRLRGGVELMRYDATTQGSVPATASLAPGSPFVTLPAAADVAWHAGGYIEAEHAPLAGLAIVAGVRADRLPGDGGVALDPRLAAAYSAGDWTVRMGGGVFHQGSWRARYRLPDPGQPAGVPRRARHLVAGVERSGTFAAKLEAYIKAYDDYAPLGVGPAVIAGTNRGIDAIARYSPRRGPNGWLSYSLLHGRVQLADGGVAPSSLDVTHSATAVARMPLGQAWELGATARYATGRPFTPVVGAAAAEDGSRSPQYGALHADRLPDYRRLDARITRYLFGDGVLALGYLEMLNLLDRRNVMSYTYDEAYTARVPIDSFFAHRTFVLGVELQFN